MWKRYNTAIVFLWWNKIQVHMTAQDRCLISALRYRVNLRALDWNNRAQSALRIVQPENLSQPTMICRRATPTCRFVTGSVLGYLDQYPWGRKRL
jgi:hypothetical protein